MPDADLAHSEVVLAPPPVPPAKVLGVCCDGKPQLPLAVHESILRHPTTSTAQVKDWLARTRKATGRIYNNH